MTTLIAYLIDSIAGANNFDILDHPWFEVKVLPGAAEVVAVVDHAGPVFLVYRHFDEVRIGPTQIIPLFYYFFIFI